MVYTDKNNNLFVLVILNTQGCIFLLITPTHHHPEPRVGKGVIFSETGEIIKILDIKRQNFSSLFDYFIPTTLVCPSEQFCT